MFTWIYVMMSNASLPITKGNWPFPIQICIAI